MVEFSVEVEVSFEARNSCLLLAFLVTTGAWDFPLVSKEKVDPILRQKLKSLPWLASVWQKARHWDAREESFYLKL